MLYKDKLMTWAAMLTAFFGFLRISEYTSLHSHSIDSNTTLLKVHTSQSSISKDFPTTIELNIKSSKTDPFKMGTAVRLAENGTMLCPIKALLEYNTVHLTKAGPLFTFQNKKFLTRRDINEALKAHLNLHSMPSQSFRIRAATTATSAGHPRWLIQSLGCWTSDCFQSYIRIPNSTILNVSKSMVDVASYNRTFDPDMI